MYKPISCFLINDEIKPTEAYSPYENMLSFWQIVNMPWNQKEGISIPIHLHHYFRLYDLQDDGGEIYSRSIRPLGSFYLSKIAYEHSHTDTYIKNIVNLVL